MRQKQLRHEFYEETQQTMLDFFCSEGMSVEEAERTSTLLVDRLIGEWGGQYVYFPRGYSAKVAARDDEIAKRYTGANSVELARELGLTVAGLKKAMGRAELRKRGTSRKGPRRASSHY